MCQLSFACSQTYSDLIQTIQSDSGRIFTPSVTTEVWDTKGVVRLGEVQVLKTEDQRGRFLSVMCV